MIVRTPSKGRSVGSMTAIAFIPYLELKFLITSSRLSAPTNKASCRFAFMYTLNTFITTILPHEEKRSKTD